MFEIDIIGQAVIWSPTVYCFFGHQTVYYLLLFYYNKGIPKEVVAQPSGCSRVKVQL